MPNYDSPTTTVRSNATSSSRNLAIAVCLIIGIAAVSVRAIVVDGDTPTRTRVARTSRIAPLASRAAPTREVASTAIARDAVSPSKAVETSNAARIEASTKGARLSDVARPSAVVPTVPSALSHSVQLTPAIPTAAALTGSSLLSPGTTPVAADPFRRAPLDWRAIVAHPGVTFGFEEITDASAGSSAFSGARSVRTHSNLELTLDLDSLLGWRGLTIYAQHKTKTGRNGSGEAAFVQNFSNIDADDFRALGEVWVEQRVLRDRLSIKAGRIDFNSVFAGTDNGASFLNASMGFSPSIVAAPTFPLPTWGVEATVSPWSLFNVGVGVFDGRDGAPAPVGGTSRFQIAQANQQWALGRSQLVGRVGAGAWRHTGMFSALGADPDADPGVAGTRGWYATLDQTLWEGRARGDDADNHASVAAFAQMGTSSPNVQSIHAHRGVGFTVAGLLAARPSDLIGVGVTHASWGSGRETIGELFYQLPVTSHLSLVADVQRVRRLDGPSLRAFGNVATMRTVLSF
ncbi:carbohydrate porin [Gemmatimonas groenlandica]|uniref:Porin n=1 Tax=Gemmatimonas groenlandica TaxID=2732249 RepID=A0A6M4IUA1_9BACT|nr:carbohydrate porin [Gemmatimonas groenlandica]QJR37708.1 hypothetical protein HKW67_20375 [Gemmatimonas groenlandica]